MIPYFELTTISLGPVTIQVWGLLVSLGIGVSMLILWKRAHRTGLPAEALLDQAIAMIVLGFVFARLAHVLLYEPAFYLANPLEIVKVWHGGFSSFGGFVGAGLGFYWHTIRKKLKKETIIKIADEYSFASLYGWMVGRIGCFCIHDHLGVPCGNHCLFAVSGPDQPRFDMALLEIIGLLPLAIIFYIVRKQERIPGWYTSLLFVYYGVLRLLLDFLRARDIDGSDARYLGLTPGQYFAIVMIALGIVLGYKRKVFTAKD